MVIIGALGWRRKCCDGNLTVTPDRMIDWKPRAVNFLIYSKIHAHDSGDTIIKMEIGKEMTRRK